MLRPPRPYVDKISERALRGALKLPPEKIVRAYKNRSGQYWILVEFERGYDLYKHFKLKERDRYAVRLPRIVLDVCPNCGGDIVEGICVECGREVERPKRVEVWRDRFAEEEVVGPINSVEEDFHALTFKTSEDEIRIPRHVVKEFVISLVKRVDGVYLRWAHFRRTV